MFGSVLVSFIRIRSKFQPSQQEMRDGEEYELHDNEHIRQRKLTDARANLQPAALVFDQEKKVECHHVTERQHEIKHIGHVAVAHATH